MANQIRVVIADDHPIVRNGLSYKITQASMLRVVGEAGDGETALKQIEELRPDIAVLDIGMPKLDGLEVARRISRLLIDTKIVFLTLHKDEDFFRAAMEMGARGYLLKENASEEIIAGLQAIIAGGTYVSSAMSQYLIQRQEQGSPIPPTTAQFTSTERAILKLIAQGQTSKEIGEELCLSYRTIENHRTNMCRKLNVEGANALLRFALEHRLFSGSE